MSRAAANLAFAVMALALTSETTTGQSPLPTGPDAEATSPLQTTNPTLQASLERIASRSALWREAVLGLRGVGRRALILTPEQVVTTDASGNATAFDASVLAEVAPVRRGDSKVDTVLVVVNLALLEQIHRRKDSLPGEFDSDLDRILVHEVYGHAVPYLAAGDLSGRCPDPRPDQRASEACSIRRENAVRAELGLGRRVDPGLEGLTLARRDFR